MPEEEDRFESDQVLESRAARTRARRSRKSRRGGPDGCAIETTRPSTPQSPRCRFRACSVPRRWRGRSGIPSSIKTDATAPRQLSTRRARSCRRNSSGKGSPPAKRSADWRWPTSTSSVRHATARGIAKRIATVAEDDDRRCQVLEGGAGRRRRVTWRHAIVVALAIDGMPSWRHGEWMACHHGDHAQALEATQEPPVTCELWRPSAKRVRTLLATGPIALLCACGDWRRCHRTLVTDLLAEEGVPIARVRMPAGTAQ